MSASSTCSSRTVCNLGLVSARCTAFTRNHRENDYTFVFDLEWSDERVQSVKRSFGEFRRFHQQLCRAFPELRRTEHSKLQLSSSLRENVINLFNKDKRSVAESRECALDQYVRNLLRQPERVKYSNVVLAFFEPRETDPRPCKSHSPAEKSDSGIDLTVDQSSVNANILQPSSVQSRANEGSSNQSRCGNETASETDCQPDDESECSTGTCYTGTCYSSEEYEAESEIETDNESYEEDYFIDVGDLMLRNAGEDSTQPTSPTESGLESSMWCSNLDKFSNILRSSMSNLHTAGEATHKTFNTLTSIDDDEREVDVEMASVASGQGESSETESQMNADESQLPDTGSAVFSSDEDIAECKKLSESGIKHYYLSTGNLTSLVE